MEDGRWKMEDVRCGCFGFGLFGGVADGEGGGVGILQDDGDDAVRGVEVGHLVVVLQHGAVGPGAEFLLQSVTQLLPHHAGAVVRREGIALLNGHQFVGIVCHQDTIGFGSLAQDDGMSAVGGCRVDGKATCDEGVDELSYGHGACQSAVVERCFLPVGAGHEGHEGHEE